MTKVLLILLAALALAPAAAGQLEGGGGGGPLSTGQCTYWTPIGHTYDAGDGWRWWCNGDGYVWYQGPGHPGGQRMWD